VTSSTSFLRHSSNPVSLLLGTVHLLLLAPLASAQLPEMGSEALDLMRGYYATINEHHKQDIILLEGPDGRLYFPLAELASYIDSEKALLLAEDAYGCSPCIPLDKVAKASFDEASNRATILIHDSYRPPQLMSAAIDSDQKSLPLIYGGGLATSVNFLGRYDEETDGEDYAADLNLGVGLGRLGNLYSSAIFFKESDSRRGQTFWESYFDRAMIQVQAGDVISHNDSFGGALQLGGLRIRRAFETRPSFNFHPSFKYFAEARLPGTLELLLDGKSIRKEEYDRGRLSISSGIPRHGEELTLVLTDVIGNRTTIRQPLFDSSDNLAPGVVDFDVSYGAVREDQDHYTDKLGSAFISTGITKYWTQGLSFQGNGDYTLVSTEVILSAGNHQLNLEGAYSQEKTQPQEGNATVANYSYDWRGEKSRASFGVNWFDAQQFSQFRGNVLSGSGTVVAVGAGRGRFSYGVSGFEIGDLRGGSIKLGYSGNRWSVAAGTEYLDTDDYIATLTLNYRPLGTNKPRVRMGHSWERDNRSVAAGISGSLKMDGNYLGYQAAAGKDYYLEGENNSVVDSRAGLSFRNNVVDMSGNYDDIGDATRGSARIKTGFVINRHNAFFTARNVSQAYATVLTEREGLLIKGGGYQRKTDSDGVASVPVSAFYPSSIVIDRETLAENDVLTKLIEKVRVAKGNHGTLEMQVMQAPILIHILHNGINDIFINGRPFVHNDFGAYINQYNAGGENELVVDGKRYTIQLPVVKDELPIYEFDRANNRLIRVNELFREAE
jgi:outer membrane usher protein FimD/PapC